MQKGATLKKQHEDSHLSGDIQKQKRGERHGITFEDLKHPSEIREKKVPSQQRARK